MLHNLSTRFLLEGVCVCVLLMYVCMYVTCIYSTMSYLLMVTNGYKGYMCGNKTKLLCVCVCVCVCVVVAFIPMRLRS